jgi:hypothetical protein
MAGYARAICPRHRRCQPARACLNRRRGSLDIAGQCRDGFGAGPGPGTEWQLRDHPRNSVIRIQYPIHLNWIDRGLDIRRLQFRLLSWFDGGQPRQHLSGNQSDKYNRRQLHRIRSRLLDGRAHCPGHQRAERRKDLRCVVRMGGGAADRVQLQYLGLTLLGRRTLRQLYDPQHVRQYHRCPEHHSHHHPDADLLRLDVPNVQFRCHNWNGTTVIHFNGAWWHSALRVVKQCLADASA